MITREAAVKTIGLCDEVLAESKEQRAVVELFLNGHDDDGR